MSDLEFVLFFVSLALLVLSFAFAADSHGDERAEIGCAICGVAGVILLVTSIVMMAVS